MTFHELLKTNKTLIETMLHNSISINDVGKLPVFEEYERMERNGEKKGYIVCYLAEKYSMTERGIYKLVSRMRKVVTI